MKCDHKKEDGAGCNQSAMKGSQFCYWHSPEIPDAKKQLARSRGGSKSLLMRKPLKQISSLEIKNISIILDQVYSRLAEGLLPIATVKAICDIMSLQIKTLETSVMEDKINEIINYIEKA